MNLYRNLFNTEIQEIPFQIIKKLHLSKENSKREDLELCLDNYFSDLAENKENKLIANGMSWISIFDKSDNFFTDEHTKILEPVEYNVYLTNNYDLTQPKLELTGQREYNLDIGFQLMFCYSDMNEPTQKYFWENLQNAKKNSLILDFNQQIIGQQLRKYLEEEVDNLYGEQKEIITGLLTPKIEKLASQKIINMKDYLEKNNKKEKNNVCFLSDYLS